MEQNKSIDGLKPRRAKPTTPKKVKTGTTKPVAIKVVEPTPKPVTPPTPEPSLPSTAPEKASPKPEATDDFLSPIQAFNLDEASGKLEAAVPINKKEAKKAKKAEKKAKKEKKKPSKVRRIITWIALIIVLALIGLITWAVLWGNDIIAKITGGQGNVFDLVKFIEPTYDPLKTDANGRTNILAFGTSGYNMEGDEGEGVHDGAQLTDSIMFISLNQETGDFTMLSLPRDLKASPTCTATGKINEVYWCNNMYGEDEAAGATALMEEVGYILGVDFQYYAHLNWGSLVEVVDILGGIDVTLDEDILDYYYTEAVFEAGQTYHINGEQALGLARARHGTTGGDFSRGASQQKIIIGIKNRFMEKQLSITDFISIASSLGDNLRTNFSIDEMKSFAHLAFQFDFDNMRQISLIDPYWFLTTGMINDISYVLPRAGVGNYGDIQEYVAEMTSNDPRVYEHPTILVLNGTEEAWLASNEATKLEEKGYPEVTADNAPEGKYPTGTTIYSVTTEKTGTKKMLEELYETEAKPLSELPESFSQNYDFVILLGDPEVETEN